MALNLAIDANRYRDFLRGVPEATQVISTAEHVFLPFIVVGELRGCFHKGSRYDENGRELTRFLSKPRVEGRSYHPRLRRPVRGAESGRYANPPNDLWIAALVLQHDLVLFSRDRHFDRITRKPITRPVARL